MTGSELEGILVEELGYTQSSGFVRGEDIPWRSGRLIPHVTSAYLIDDVPVAFFSRLGDADPQTFWRLYRSVWSHSRVPLLYVVSPEEIRVYNVFADPAREPGDLDHEDRLLRQVSALVNVETARQTLRHELAGYSRIQFDTGAFWSTPEGQKVKPEKRADQRLLQAMNQVRRHLVSGGLGALSAEVAYALLGRSVFIRYLEDRGVLTPGALLNWTGGAATNYRTALTDVAVTYRLFENLSRRFNGDLFPVDYEERQYVQQVHLNLLGDFLDGTDLDTGQRSFWPFDFQYVPVEVISGIYDTFIQTRKQAGTYYTPLSLVDFVLEETLPPESLLPGMKILDPACGSGIFLIGAYERFIEAWKRHHQSEALSAEQLRDILRQSIFGVDINHQAVRIAAFSLYLTMLDHLDNDAVQDPSFRFPKLSGSNLVSADFFDPKVPKLLGGGFHRIIGNPPWGKSTLTRYAEEWLKSRQYTVGQKQIAQAFLLYCPEFCSADGEAALLAPAKATILVNSGPHEDFRRRFFDLFHVRAILNFSVLRHTLFPESSHPSVALFYSRKPPIIGQQKIAYGVPRPSPMSRQLGAIFLDSADVKFIDRDEFLQSPELWKVALWGTTRDAALIQRLKSLPTLEEQAKTQPLDWFMAEGIQINGGDENPAPWLRGKPLVSTDQFQRYVVNMDASEPITAEVFHRPRVAAIVSPPLALIHQSPIQRRCAAAFSSESLAYRDKISGVSGHPGQESLLKWLVAYINSPLAQYFHFMTSTSWGVERDTIIHEEYLRMPFLVPALDDPKLRKVVRHFDRIAAILQAKSVWHNAQLLEEIRHHEDVIAGLVFDVFGLTSSERQLVRDAAVYAIDYFYWTQRIGTNVQPTKAILSPDVAMIKAYARIFRETVAPLLGYEGKALNAIVYHNGSPLSIVGLELVDIREVRDVRVLQRSVALRETLQRLDGLLLSQHGQDSYMRRHVRIYDGRWLYLIRPSEARCWTQSQARSDADAAIAEWLSVSRTERRALA